MAKDGQTPTSAVIPFANGIKSDTVAEQTSNTGVTVDGVLLKDGGATLTADLSLGADIVFEGSTANDFETTITVTDPTADRTITLPNATGTVLLNVAEDTTPQLGGPLDTNANQVRWSKGTDVASANALSLGNDGNYFDITGTTAIISIGTKAIGTVVKLHFDAALTLTHHATDLVLPGAGNITTAAGDEAEFIEYATGDWRCTNYTRANGTAVVSLSQATQTAIESETDEDTYVPPDLVKHSPGVAKVWGKVDRSAGTPTLDAPDYNIASVTDDGVGQTIVTIDVDFSTDDYAFGANASSASARTACAHTPAVGSFKVEVIAITNAAEDDTTSFTCWAFGDQA